MSLDFYLPDYNIAIECQGRQHFEPIDYFGGYKGFVLTQERDKIKKELCENHNIDVIEYIIDKRIHYDMGIYNETDLIKKIYGKTKTICCY